MGEGTSRTQRSFEAVSIETRVEIAEAMSSYDGERVADALMAAVQGSLAPAVALGFVVEPDNTVELRRLAADPLWRSWLSEGPDFSWAQPLLAHGVQNGAALIGPSVNGASQIAAVMDLGAGRFTYFVIVGDYPDPQQARRQLAEIAGESGTASQLIMRSNERAADLAMHRERERLSRDLHDSLSQSLWSLSMLSETAASMIDADDPVRAVIRQIADISLTSQEEMRALLINLRTAEPSRESVASVLEALVADFSASNDVEIIASIAEADLDADTIMALRRIAEEALNNVSRHANASTVAVLFDPEPAMCLRIADDGDGFDAKPVKGHLGLRVMRERAAGIDFEFDLASRPGAGTVVTVASDLSVTRPRPWSRPPRELPGRRSALASLLAGVLLAALAVGSLFVSRSFGESADEAQIGFDVLTVLEQRVLVSRASADEATARLFEGVGVATSDDVEAAMTERSLVISRARDKAEPLVNLQTLSGQYALLFLDALSGAELTVPAEQRLDQLFTEVDRMEGPAAQPSVEATTPTHSVGNLASLNQVVAFTTLEVIVARYALEPSAFDLPEPTRLFIENYVEFVQGGGGGFFGPDPSMAFHNGLTSDSIASVHEREALITLNQIIDESGLWNDDRWLRSWSREGSQPPTSIESYVERSRAATVQGRELIDARFAARSAELSADRDLNRSRERLLRTAAALLAVPALVALALALRSARRRRRALLVDRTIDPLTGLGNRRALDTQVAKMMKDLDHAHHVVITLDMDRFAFINDVHGRAFGDRMLEVVGIGLKGFCEMAPAIRGTAVRIGGDEFLVSLHSSAPIPAELVTQAINRLRSTVISTPDGELVRCSFSYGMVAAVGSPSLDSLMTACDLALYEDKARLDATRAG